ncbi:jg15002 [Pararge aegeria aegeria]|uniref:Jg15002 protein n=1 Tax=Pararge aegeria aegeria TaxID=348720 RepID=A0A8S4QI74_9NEOP|nr:jg15002 [Pararge aegeria aegeria]
MVHVAQDCGGAVCSLAEPATGLRFSEPCGGRAASRVTSPAKLKYPRCPAFHSLHTAPHRYRQPPPHFI